jgi:hypothetical protein
LKKTALQRLLPSTIRVQMAAHSLKRLPTLTSVVFCRTDYHLAYSVLAQAARAAAIYKAVKFSDHAPLTVDYDFDH